MKLTYETINLLMLLMPGLISSNIFELLRRKSAVSNFEKITQSFIFTFLIYITVNITYKWEPLAQAVKSPNGITYQISTDISLILLTIAYAIILPVIWGSIVHHDFHMKLLRFFELTDRTSRDTAWDDVFTNEKRFLTVHLNDERRITGWPLYYSNNEDEGFIYLSQSAWLSPDNEYVDTESHGILISKDKIDLIEFMNPPK